MEAIFPVTLQMSATSGDSGVEWGGGGYYSGNYYEEPTVKYILCIKRSK